MKTFVFALCTLFSTQSFAFECSHYASNDGRELHFIKRFEFIVIEKNWVTHLYDMPSMGTGVERTKVRRVLGLEYLDYDRKPGYFILDGAKFNTTCK